MAEVTPEKILLPGDFIQINDPRTSLLPEIGADLFLEESILAAREALKLDILLKSKDEQSELVKGSIACQLVFYAQDTAGRLSVRPPSFRLRRDFGASEGILMELHYIPGYSSIIDVTDDFLRQISLMMLSVNRRDCI